jgi:hypothetical protein
MATASTAFADTVWPHSAHHPFGTVSASGHHDGVDPLDPLQLASVAIPSENFGSGLHNPNNDPLNSHRDTESPGANVIKYFLSYVFS